ncbi:hypothetical protein [Siphonobacter sp. SORGH_AS_1065]|uniref:hypothetical protein n=1 Tax=Siphonobacter sp. SORGH_AS_1065 TaxID=3041795 RepID=UPI002784F306|nr:hypothetical protein [Siphonobacter sp. SORGH_AS_1065]MDQ1087191.1 hypothetical protein [Siphonobacter sp. SORGH_AS_1065]
MKQEQQSDASKLERALSLSNLAIFTIELQHRRLQTAEAEDEEFIFRWMSDLEFLIIALIRLQKAAFIAASVPSVKKKINRAIAEFNQSLPDLKKMRDVIAHIDDYALNKERRTHNVGRTELQVGQWNGSIYKWIGGELDVDKAVIEAIKLFKTVCEVHDGYPSPS